MTIEEFMAIKPYDEVKINKGILKDKIGYVLWMNIKSCDDSVPISIPGVTELGDYVLCDRKNIDKIQG